MSRRSRRLMPSGTYQSDDDAASSSSAGSTSQVSYKESLVRIFRRKSGGRKAGSSRSAPNSNASSDLGVQYAADEPITTEESWDITPTLRAGLQRRTFSSVRSSSTEPKLLSSTGTTEMSYTSDFQEQSSGYSSSEEGFYRPTLSSAQSAAEPRLGFKDMIRSPVRAMAMLFWWTGTAWYSLTSGFSLLDVFLLSRRTAAVRKVILLLLVFIILAFAAWYWYPSILGLFSRGAARRPGPLRSTTDTGVLQGEATGAPMLPVLREEIRSQLEERESRWMEEREKAKQESHREWERMQREIALLRQDREKLEHVSETLRSELQQLKLSVKNFETEHRSFLGQELAGMEKNIADLQAGISSLHISTDLLRQQVESQQTMNAEMKGELSKWIVSYLSSGAQGTDLVLQPELQQALGDLERRLLQKLAEEREKEQPDMWRSVGETLQREGAGAVTVEDIQQIVHRALRLFHADGIGMADYALESSGGSVINTRCSKTYTTRTTCISLFGIPLWYQSESPRTVIQPDVYPGKCWAFQGSEGFLVISLSYPIQITHVTLEHLPKVLSPTGHIDSAPRDFSVYGMSADKEDTEEGALLGTFTYDQDGEPVQTFRLSDNDSTQQVYQKVELRILSNWGHLEFTCIYRFRVHGKRWVG
ncbi:SUN domain-containing protein 2-like [Scleropages formosus]|uniref:Sad1 and UNC84 domain containing 2 n=1 Tax=Scleropages formosus TaxID=113540 RepID=A0A8C9VA65_SCLFO|nr:SUN domain-containing protein 2 [Scleropages formosus]